MTRTRCSLLLVAVVALGVAAFAAGPGTLSFKGGDGEIKVPTTLQAGVYVITHTGGGALVSVSFRQGDSPVYTTMFNEPNETDIMAVQAGGQMAKPGPATFEGDGMEAYTVTFTRAETLPLGALPVVLSAPEMKAALSKPFKVAAGTLTVTYKYKAEPKGTGTLGIFEVTTGKALPTKFMSAHRIGDTYTMTVDKPGTYIAFTRFPLASNGGEVKISQ